MRKKEYRLGESEPCLGLERCKINYCVQQGVSACAYRGAVDRRYKMVTATAPTARGWVPNVTSASPVAKEFIFMRR